jgi:hypothetical protein
MLGGREARCEGGIGRYRAKEVVEEESGGAHQWRGGVSAGGSEGVRRRRQGCSQLAERCRVEEESTLTNREA